MITEGRQSWVTSDFQGRFLQAELRATYPSPGGGALRHLSVTNTKWASWFPLSTSMTQW